jgi:hypothetical protein
LPQKTHKAITNNTKENPNIKSSTGADAMRTPSMASGLYITIFLEVNHQFVMSWKGKIIE